MMQNKQKPSHITQKDNNNYKRKTKLGRGTKIRGFKMVFSWNTQNVDNNIRFPKY